MLIYSLADHVSQRVILLVNRKNRSIWYFGILFFYNSTKNANINVFLEPKSWLDLDKYQRSAYFFSPSYNKNDSKVGGAFISLRQLLTTIQN